MENELYHYGVKGQRWGVRRYQNPDGSLTMAGKKRALKIQQQYTDLTRDRKYHDNNGEITYAGRKKALKMREEYGKVTGGKRLTSFTPGPNTKLAKPNKKISEMSNDEIRSKIERLELESRLKMRIAEATPPAKVSKGKQFVNGVRDSALNAAKDKGVKVASDYLEKMLRTKLGLTEKEMKSASQILKEEAEDAKNEWTRMNYRNKIKEEKAKEKAKEKEYKSSENPNKSSNSDNSSEKFNKSDDIEILFGNVEGKGSSSKRSSGESYSKKYYDEPIDAEWREVNDDNINKGKAYALTIYGY